MLPLFSWLNSIWDIWAHYPGKSYMYLVPFWFVMSRNEISQSLSINYELKSTLLSATFYISYCSFWWSCADMIIGIEIQVILHRLLFLHGRVFLRIIVKRITHPMFVERRLIKNSILLVIWHRSQNPDRLFYSWFKILISNIYYLKSIAVYFVVFSF